MIAAVRWPPRRRHRTPGALARYCAASLIRIRIQCFRLSFRAIREGSGDRQISPPDRVRVEMTLAYASECESGSVAQAQRRMLVQRAVLQDHHVAAVVLVEQHRDRRLEQRPA